MQRLTIIIPILNEIKILQSSLNYLSDTLGLINDPDFIVQVIISDAGSRDGSIEVLKKMSTDSGWDFVFDKIDDPSIGKTILNAMNYAKSEYVLVLPIDCYLSLGAFEDLQKLPSDVIYGGFAKKYRASNKVFLNLYARLQNMVRARIFKNIVWTNAIFAKKSLWQNESLFQPHVFLEDIIFSDNLKRTKGKYFFSSEVVSVSPRLYLQGTPLYRVLVNGLILLLYRLGLRDLSLLKSLYGRLKD